METRDNSMRFMVEAPIPKKPEGAEELEKQGLGELVRALHEHTDPQVRQYAAYLLGKAKNPRAIQPLVESLADFDKSVREQAMLALSSIGKAAVGSLAEAMKEPKWETRYRAAEALGKIADEKAVKPLIAGLRDSRDHVRYMAAKSLHEIGDSDAVEPLIILLKDENTYVRTMAVHALGALGGKTVKAALTKALESEEDEKVKAAITSALG
jgi:HEAT repeat protein